MSNASTGTVVRAWAVEQGLEVGARGKFSQSLQDAFNAAHPRAKYVAGTPASQAHSAKPAKGRTVTRQVVNSQARAWGLAAGLDVGARGRLGQDVLDAYVLNAATAERNAREAAKAAKSV